jgi:serine/threonine-protein kinase
MRTLIDMTEPHPSLRASLAGRYDIERELGEGGMATVYAAHDVRHGRKVAIKVMRPEVAASLGSERFLSEIQLTAKLQHPHILGLIDSGAFADGSGTRPFYVMPLIDGETLRTRLGREARLPISDAIPLLTEIADALVCAHGYGIVHRDIKPENILLNQGHALVADFGVAKALHHSLDGASITRTGVSVGTPVYMAPEQVVADPGIDGRADLYALGVIAFEMVAGRTPFAGASIAAMVKASLTTDAPRLSATVPTCPERLSSLVASLLEKDPDKRPRTALEVRERLRSITAFPSAELPPARASRRWRALSLGALAVLVAGIVVARWRPWRSSTRGSAPASAVARSPRSIAVLPFRNINNDSAADYFADGLTEELISALGRLRRLRVASRTSTFAMKGHGGSVADIARQLGVDAIVEASLRHDADSVLINASLVDVRNDSTLWAGEYKGGLRNVLYVQDSVAQSIANALSALLGIDAGKALAPPRPADPRAYDAYVRGRVFLGQRNPVSMASAIRSLELAIQLDSSFAPAYAGLADAYSLLAPFGSRPPRDVFPLARAAAQRAFALDSTLADAHTSLGIVAMFYDWDWVVAGRELQRGIAVNPSSAEGHLFYAWYLALQGRLQDAISEASKAQELDQLSPVITTRYANMLQFAGRDAEAVPLFRRALALDSTFFYARLDLAMSLLQLDQADEARRLVSGEIVYTADYEGAFPAWIFAKLGDSSAARAQTRKMEEATQHRYVSADALAGAYAAVGDTARALNMLERAADDRAFTLIFLPYNSMFTALRGNPRYEKIVKQVGAIGPK